MRSARSKTVTRWPARLQLLGGGEPGRSRADDGDALAGPRCRRLRGDPAFGERALDDRRFGRLDRDRRVVDPEHARRLARRRTQASGELGEVVRRVQPVDRRAPAIAVDEIVPVGNQVAERAALMAERNAAVHAARRLILQRRVRGTAAGLRASRARARRPAATAASAAGFRESRSTLPMGDLRSARDVARGRPPASASRASARL